MRRWPVRWVTSGVQSDSCQRSRAPARLRCRPALAHIPPSARFLLAEEELRQVPCRSALAHTPAFSQVPPVEGRAGWTSSAPNANAVSGPGQAPTSGPSPSGQRASPPPAPSMAAAQSQNGAARAQAVCRSGPHLQSALCRCVPGQEASNPNADDDEWLIQAVRFVRGPTQRDRSRACGVCRSSTDCDALVSRRSRCVFAELAFENASVIVILVCMAGFGLLYQAVKYLSTVVSGGLDGPPQITREIYKFPG